MSSYSSTSLSTRIGIGIGTGMGTGSSIRTSTSIGNMCSTRASIAIGVNSRPLHCWINVSINDSS